MTQQLEVSQKVRRAILDASDDQATIHDEDSLVLSLGFNSLKVVTLALELERQFERPLLLNDWVGRCPDPTLLTVRSLCDYVWEVVQRGD